MFTHYRHPSAPLKKTESSQEEAVWRTYQKKKKKIAPQNSPCKWLSVHMRKRSFADFLLLRNNTIVRTRPKPQSATLFHHSHHRALLSIPSGMCFCSFRCCFVCSTMRCGMRITMFMKSCIVIWHRLSIYLPYNGIHGWLGVVWPYLNHPT